VHRALSLAGLDAATPVVFGFGHVAARECVEIQRTAAGRVGEPNGPHARHVHRQCRDGRLWHRRLKAAWTCGLSRRPPRPPMQCPAEATREADRGILGEAGLL
jgi:hypothetical protein